MNIVDEIGLPAALEQCAEECSELTQACLKLARKLRNENPTPKTLEECRAALAEEMSDTRECMNVLLNNDFSLVTEVNAAAEQKRGRWMQRIAEKAAEEK